MTFGELSSELYRALGYQASPASDVTTRLQSFLNLTHRQLLSTPGMERLRDDIITAASTASQAYLALPPTVARVKAIIDTTNGFTLRSTDLRTIRQMNPQANEGTPSIFATLGPRGVSTQPANASAIFVDSTSGSDTNDAYIEGVRTGGYREVNSVTMTGTTGVQIGSLSDWIQIDEFYLTGAAVGTVTLHEDAEGGTTLSTIPIGATKARYLHLILDPVPDSAITYTIDYVRHIEDMSIANDEPLIPEDLHWVLVAGAKAKEYERREDPTRLSMALQEYAEGRSLLKYWIMTQGAKALGRRKPEFSQLGSNYPPGS